MYVLQDNAFKPIQRISSWQGRAEALRKSRLVRASFAQLEQIYEFFTQYAALPAGIIKGALSRLGFQAVVVPEITTLPQCEQSSSLFTC